MKKSETKKQILKKEVDLWLNHFAYQTINRFIMEADASGCDFLQVNTSGKVEGYGEEDGELKKMYEDTIERLPDSNFSLMYVQNLNVFGEKFLQIIPMINL